ncbi:MAG: LLM class flavin-dependent oxidoreductase [Thermomicrobiales bacterium]
MPKQMLLNAFEMNSVGHGHQGLWTHPRDQSSNYNTLQYWADLARLLERGLFDGVFLADVLGVYDVYRGSPATALTHAVQIPINDPTLVIPVMAQATTHLGFGVTCNLIYEPPFQFARRMSTLDHLTNGRIGWNIVTGYTDSAARAQGLDRQIPHDDRYDAGDEYMEVVYKLWEGSWEDDAVQRDRARGVFTDPAKVHPVQHEGQRFRLNALHLAEPSPQRTPVLYQAGASTRGRQFAARHAECVFVGGPTKPAVRALTDDVRRLAAEAGRDPADIKFFCGRTVIVGRTEQEARDKAEEYRSYTSIDGALTHFSASTGIDFSLYELDEPITHVKNDANNSLVESITSRSSETWTVRKITERMQMGHGSIVPLVGSPEQIADELISWLDEAGVDGFNLGRTVTPECHADFIDLVVPILQERGRYKRDYAEGTLREKLFGAGRARLAGTHTGASYRYGHQPAPVPA